MLELKGIYKTFNAGTVNEKRAIDLQILLFLHFGIIHSPVLAYANKIIAHIRCVFNRFF